ncbi:unnamed protein product [Prorocentrum cordatum]|uniref:Uncharacterized protein n=1 Tax=Prorocentrum cordatum TaxID=2364126 RepID=A0ABN9TYB6_9DINO|nr:unnamed protein product [Polarella glacialis]
MARALSPGEAAAPSAPVPISPPPWLSESFPRRESGSRCARAGCGSTRRHRRGAGRRGVCERCPHRCRLAQPLPGPAAEAGGPMVLVFFPSAICGEPLMGLPDNAVGAVFGRRFADGAELLLLSSAELRRAEIERDAAGECPCEEPGEPEDPTRVEDLANYDLLRRTKSSTEYDAVVRIPVGRSAVWRLSADVMALLENDLTVLGGKFGVSAKPQLNRDGDVQCVVVSGLSTAIASARSEVVQVLQFYRQGQGLPGAATGPADRSSWAEDRPREEARAAGAAVACGVRVEVPRPHRGHHSPRLGPDTSRGLRAGLRRDVQLYDRPRQGRHRPIRGRGGYGTRSAGPAVPSPR